MPESADGYALNLDDAAKSALKLDDPADPLLKGIREQFKAEGKSQGAFDDFMSTAAKLAEAGLFDTGFDVAAETAKLGENAEGRRREVELFANALKERDGFDEEMAGELVSLAPTAAGVRLIEFLRKQMGPAGEIPTPASDGGGDPVEHAKAMRRDPRYETDRDFRKQADAAWQAAHRAR